jgi:hypothetical protein
VTSRTFCRQPSRDKGRIVKKLCRTGT